MGELKFSWLQALIAAVDQGSIRAAAKQLGSSQPAVTRLVRDLERGVGAQMLVRSTGGVVPTAHGKVLLDHARRVMRELDSARTEIDQLTGRMVGEISLAAAPLAVLLLIPQAMRTFGREFPEMQLRLREELYMERLRLLREGKVDIAVGPIPSGIPASEFEVEVLMPAEMAVVVGRGHPLSRATSLQEVAQGRWVYTSAQLGKEDYSHQWFLLNGISPPVPAAIVNSTLSVLSLLTSGDYVAMMPLRLVRHPAAAPHITVVPITEGCLSLQLGAITVRKESVKPAVRHFLAHLHRAAHAAMQE